MRDALTLELRVLSGRHAGASTLASHGLLLGAGEEADIILTDLEQKAGVARLSLLGTSHWLLTPFNSEPTDEDWAGAPEVGVPSHWGGLALCVSAPHTDWPPLPVATRASPDSLEHHLDPGGSDTDTDRPEPLLADEAPHLKARAITQPERMPATPADRSAVRSVVWIGLAILLILALLALAAMISERMSRQPPTSSDLSAGVPGADLTEQAQGKIPELKLVIARVDPTLQLQLTPQKDGQVRVSGWVESVAQLDRLADALGTRRPAPLMRVLVASDVRVELRAQLAGRFPHLDFSPGGAGMLRVRGIVLSEEARHEVLGAVRPLLPAGLQLQDDLRLAEKMAPDVRAALAAAGFADAKASWDGRQVVATLSLPDGARARFEKELLALAERFPGLPLRVTPQAVVVASQSDRGKPPFPIRSVVGGAVPYVILQGGEKLLPGGAHAGWRLQSIEPDVLVFDSPRRLVVQR